MVFLSNPQVWHLPGTWSERPIDGPYLGMTSSHLSWVAASILVTLLIAFSVYILETVSYTHLTLPTTPYV